MILFSSPHIVILSFLIFSHDSSPPFLNDVQFVRVVYI